MNWSRVKTILIILFLFTDILLGIGVISSTHKATAIEPEIINSTVSLLAERSISINPDIIPVKTPGIAYIDAENIISDYDSFAENIFMDNKPRKNDDLTYETDRYILSFSGDSFTYKCKDAEKPFNDIMANGDPENRAKTMAADFLTAHGFNIRHADVQAAKTENGYDIKFTGKSGKIPIFSSAVTVSVTGIHSDTGELNGVSSVGGSWFNVIRQNGSDVELKSITGILIEFMSEYNSAQPVTVTDLTLGYTVFEADTLHRSATLVPVWRITLSNGNEYYYDARNTD